MKLLVLGGTYFVGRAILRALVGTGRDITLLHRGSRQSPVKVQRDIHCDRRDATALCRSLDAHYDAVVDVSGYEPSDLKPVLNCIRSVGRYVYVSSAAVYDSKKTKAPFDEGAPVGGDAVWGDYGTLKSECEHLLTRSLSCPVHHLRAPYFYGPDNYLDRETFVWARAQRSLPIPLPRAGDSQLQFCHVDDFASLVAATLDGQVPPGALNVAEAHSYSMRHWCEIVAQTIGKEPKLQNVYTPGISAREFFPFRDYSIALNVSAVERLGVVRFRSLKDGLRHTHEARADRLYPLELTPWERAR